MANEIRVQISLQIKKGNLTFQSQPTTIQDDMDADPAAPSPGRITVSVDGTDVDLSKVTDPGWCWIHNLDDTNWVEVGPYNPDQSEFYPQWRLEPGQMMLGPLSPNVNEEYAGTGTGTTGQLNTLRIQAANEPCECEVYVFER